MEMTLGFNRNTKTKDALKRVLKLFPITDRFSAALYIPISRSWMPLDTTLEELHLEENVHCFACNCFGTLNADVP